MPKFLPTYGFKWIDPKIGKIELKEKCCLIIN